MGVPQQSPICTKLNNKVISLLRMFYYSYKRLPVVDNLQEIVFFMSCLQDMVTTVKRKQNTTAALQWYTATKFCRPDTPGILDLDWKETKGNCLVTQHRDFTNHWFCQSSWFWRERDILLWKQARSRTQPAFCNRFILGKPILTTRPRWIFSWY